MPASALVVLLWGRWRSVFHSVQSGEAGNQECTVAPCRETILARTQRNPHGKDFGTANGNRTRILALKGLRANRCTIAAWEQTETK
jgi:hypothetical protein